MQRGGARSVLSIVGCFLAAMVTIPVGVFMVMQAHSGVPARTTVVYCPSGKAPTCAALWPPANAPLEVISLPNRQWSDEGRVMDIDRDGHTVRVKLVTCQVADESIACTGVAPPPAESVRVISLNGAGLSDVGHEIAVHFHDGHPGAFLTADGAVAPYGILGLGCISTVIGVSGLVGRRRHRGRSAARADLTSLPDFLYPP